MSCTPARHWVGITCRGAIALAGGFRALAGVFGARLGDFFALAVVASRPTVLIGGFSDSFIEQLFMRISIIMVRQIFRQCTV
jgi:hypothetical protein